jgi:hypothetical protein
VPVSEESLAATLAEAVLRVDRQAPQSEDIPSVAKALESLLYGYGADGVFELTISDDEPGRIMLVGLVDQLDETIGPLVEAKFNLDTTGSAIVDLTVRLGGEPGWARDWSWRDQLRFIENRPTLDEDWDIVLHYQLG